MARPSSEGLDERPTKTFWPSLIRWLQLKKYQYEVTFSLYMLTSTEKLIFNLVLFVLIFMLVAAASMYLPNHVTVIYRRIWYYVDGGDAGTTKSSAVVGEVMGTALSGVATKHSDILATTSRALGEL